MSIESGTSSAEARRFSDSKILEASRIPFLICGLSILALIALLILQATTNAKFLGGYVNETDSPLVKFLLAGALYIGLFVVALVSAYIGYRMVVAAGATAAVVIPPQDYALLAPLVSEGKSESIDQYVILSSLAKFTGTFTQLGLTGLPLATIGLTLFFAVLALVRPTDFLDLTKLTLGAFIGSFVQRQVERRAEQEERPDPLAEAVTPSSAA
jgi:hypothetical protein